MTEKQTGTSINSADTILWLNYINHIQEQLSANPNFKLSSYVKSSNINHNLVMAMVNLGFVKRVGRGKHVIERTDKFNEHNAVAVIRELRRIAKVYQQNGSDKRKIKKEQSEIIPDPPHLIEENIVSEEIPKENILDKEQNISELSMIQYFQSEIRNKDLLIAEMTESITIKDGYIEHLQKVTRNLLAFNSK